MNNPLRHHIRLFAVTGGNDDEAEIHGQEGRGREGIAENLYYRWPKEFLEAGKKRS